MCNKGRIVGIANEDSSDTFCAPIGMECVGWNGMSAETQRGREMAMAGGKYISLQYLVSDQALFVLQQSC